MSVFVWSVYNGATYYIDIFGKRFQSELEQLKKDVAKWQASPNVVGSPEMNAHAADAAVAAESKGHAKHDSASEALEAKSGGIETIPMLDSKDPSSLSTGLENRAQGEMNAIRERVS